MESSTQEKDRRVIPRWREPSRTPSRELESSLRVENQIEPNKLALTNSVNNWLENPTVENASDLVSAALVFGEKEVARGAAQQLVAKDSNATPAVKVVANRLITSDFAGHVEDVSILLSDDAELRSSVSAGIRRLKIRAGEFPRNAFLWMEIARQHTLISQNSAAERAMKMAIAAAPNNRFVLRAAARFFVHTDEPEQALFYLRRSSNLKNDPWLQAAEIAVSSYAGRQPRSVKSAGRILNSRRWSEFQTSELFAAIATEEMNHGSHKRAAKLFRKSIADPTDNTAAQAYWARQSIALDLPLHLSLTKGAFEARMREAIDKKLYREAIEHCVRWLNDEPFSSIPAIDGSFYAAAFLGDYELSARISERGLVANQYDPILINNSAVALANLNRTQEARNRISSVLRLVKGDSPYPVVLATLGLIAFREQDYVEGRFYYHSAFENATKQKNIDSAFRIQLHWLLEEWQLGSIGGRELDYVISQLETFSQRRNANLKKSTVDLWNNVRNRISRDGNLQIPIPGLLNFEPSKLLEVDLEEFVN